MDAVASTVAEQTSAMQFDIRGEQLVKDYFHGEVPIEGARYDLCITKVQNTPDGRVIANFALCRKK